MHIYMEEPLHLELHQQGRRQPHMSSSIRGWQCDSCCTTEQKVGSQRACTQAEYQMFRETLRTSTAEDTLDTPLLI